MTLREEFEKETGKESEMQDLTYGTWGCTEDYVEWLESKINYTRGYKQLKSLEIISFEGWKKKFVKETATDNLYEIRGSVFFGEELETEYNYDVELFKSLIV